MSTARDYADPCGTARALDVIGERWALLVVRELLLGPKRFSQLRRGLHGVSPNVLSQRLRELDEAGIVRRDTLPTPANVAVYELTERGSALEPILIELGRWGSCEPITSGNELTIDALLLAFKTIFVAPSFAATYALHVDTEWYTVAVADGSIHVVRGRPSGPSVTLECDVPTLRTFAFGRAPLVDLEAAGRLAVTGNRTLARRFPRLFQVPAA
jgi:DNA-binding HxlR family transcriptional regulator